MSNEYTFGTVQDAILALQKGEFVVVMDDEDRENEGDLIIAAELITPEKMALLIRHTSGIICTPMTQDRATLLELPPMIQNNTDPKQTAFTVSCDVEGTSTGVSAADRTLTCRALANPYAKAGQFRKPGHIFPLVAKSGGVLERRGHTEAAVDMCKLAGLTPVGVIGEIANEDGTMSRLKECHALAKQYGFVLTTVEAIVKHRELLAEAEAEAELKAQQIPPPQLLEQSQSTPVQSPPQTQTQGRSVELLAECELPIQRANKYLGIWTMRCYRSYPDGHSRHIALIKGNVAAANGPVLVRVHSECFTSHVIGSCRCDCSQQFDVALEIINNAGCGVALYVDGHEGRGIGLDKKIQAYALQQQKQVDTYTANELLNFPVDMRSYAAPRAILEHIGLNKINIISNNPTKVKEFDDIVNAIVPVICEPNEHNSDYLRAKRSYERKHSIHSASFQAALSRSSTTSPHLTQEPTAPTIASSTPTVALESSIVDNTQSVKEPADPHLSKEIPIHLPSLENIAGLRIGVIRTSWNETLVGSLHTKCIKALTEYGVHSDNIVREFDVPGSFELPFAAQSLAQSGQVDAVICFGVLIKGETMHFEYISNAVSQGLMQVQLNTGIPVVYGVLNCLTLEQAAVRCGTTGDSILPQSLAATAIRMASLKKGQNVNHSLTKPMMQPCALG